MNTNLRQRRFQKLAQLAKLKNDQDAVRLRAASDAFNAAELHFEKTRQEHQQALHESPAEQSGQSVQNQDLADHTRFVVYQEQTLESASQRLEHTRNLINQTRKIYDQSRLQLERCNKLLELTHRESKAAQQKNEQAEQDAAAALRSLGHFRKADVG